MKTLIFLASLILPAAARIGETKEQLIARYGKAEPGKDDTQLRFEKSGIYITATLWKGTCHRLCFSSSPPADGGNAFSGGFVLPGDEKAPAKPVKPATPPLTEVQVKQLMDANSGGSEWKHLGEIWITADQKRSAYVISDGSLMIGTAEITVRDEEAREAAEAKRTEGF